MENVILTKVDGVVSELEVTPEMAKDILDRRAACEKKFAKDSMHLCWNNCANADACNCKKVRDIVKKEIGEYDFVKDGYQYIDENGKVDTFVITSCDNYVEAKPKYSTQLEKARVKELKDALMMAYFGTETIDEAYVLQHDLESRGQLKNIYGRRPSEKQIEISRANLERRR